MAMINGQKFSIVDARTTDSQVVDIDIEILTQSGLALYPITLPVMVRDIEKLLEVTFLQEWEEFIKNMTHEEMAVAVRYGKSGQYPFSSTDYPGLVKQFENRWAEFGRFNPTLSKKIDRDRGR